jgi:hydroxyacylglutathione hydrolase
MQIYQLPALYDNYIFLLHDVKNNTSVVVDPGEPYPVLQQVRQLGTSLTAIWNTHHHGDHVGGNRDLLDRFPHLVVYASVADRGRIPGQSVFLQEGDRLTFADRTATVMFLPGHTRGIIAYYFPAEEPGQVGELFSADIIFSAGCGRLFEGTAAQAVAAIDRLRQLPDDTRVWAAHEYTEGNLRFALTIEPENQALRDYAAQVKAMRSRGEPTVPTTIGREKAINPFLRWDVATVRQAVGQTEAAAVFAELRRRKEAL